MGVATNNDLIYFDNSATTRVDGGVVQSMLEYMTDKYGNASSSHRAGLTVHADLDKARLAIAKLLSCKPNEIIYMASGSEADNFALRQIVRLYKSKNNGKGGHIITTAIEHKAILNTGIYLQENGTDVTYLGVDKQGRVSLDELERAVRPDTILISVMLANNEVGTIEPVKDIVRIAKKHSSDILVHTDAVQAIGKLKVDVNELGVDLLTFSGHKIYAPKGIGVLFVRENLRKELTPLIHGGSQENGLRAGTENIPYIMGLAKAAELIVEDNYRQAEYIRGLRDGFEKRILAEIPDTRVNGDIANRVVSIANITFRYIEAESVIGYVPQVCCSLGSACTAGQDAASHVLTAMCMDPVEIRGTIRFSFGKFNTADEVNRAVEYLKDGVAKLRAMSPLAK
ncbi:cysteine desulfurase NifS [Deferribacterales bacterium RsTz2092]|nr:cysteine desulfurase IscS [Deferribacterales bacterium]